MPITRCRVCDRPFFAEPLLRYENMPGAAQFLPDAAALPTDRGVVLELRQCSGCGLVQLSGEPVPYYKDVVRAAGLSEEMRGFRTRQFGRFIQQHSLTGKKVIEIGCGRGEFLAIMHRLGVEAYGLEHAQDSVMHCLSNGLKVSQGFVDGATRRLDHAPFDAFLILNFLEHFPDPNAGLAAIHDNLTEDAIGLVEVPNLDMILRNGLFAEFIGDHLLYFCKETLSATLSLNGFEVLECTEEWHDYIISAVVKKRTKLDMSHFYGYQAQLRNELDEYIRRFDEKKVAVWGAGHQALSVISLTDLGRKIRYVVDSAPFKQGRYTPATHVPIVSPDALEADPVDAVIVMAASYSDEVAGILRKRFARGVSISVLRNFRLEVLSQGSETV